MRISVRNHSDLRSLCDIEISDSDHAKLLKPPPLQDHFKAIVSIGPDGKQTAQIINTLQREAHVVEISTSAGKLRLFPVVGNGVPYVATDTPDVALANAA